VLVTVQDGSPLVKVIDFGIAKALGQQLTDKTLLTGYAQLIGSPLYMAPEQAALSNVDVDTRSDIYSLGVLLYELLTGTTPFDKERLSQISYDEMRRIIREEEPPKPSTRISTLGQAATTASTQRKSDPKHLSQLVRGELDWIVMKCLDKDRNRRYETANGLARDVERYLHDEPVQACPPAAWYRFRKFARRNRAVLAVTVCVFLALAGLGGGIGWAVRDRIAREVSLNAEVDRARDEVGALIEESKWDEASAAVQRAEKLLAAAGRSELPPQLQSLNQDVTMGLRLEEIFSHPKTEEYPGRGEQDVEYARAFQDYGIDLAVLSAAETAKRMQARRIRLELARALDIWSGMRRQTGNPGPPDWKQLLDIAKEVDPDPWRGELRDALKQGEPGALQALAASADVPKLPAGTLHLLAIALRDAGLPERAVALLRQAQRQYPGNLWINDELGWLCLTALQPRRYDDAVRFYTVVSAMRPRNPYALRSLGRALRGRGSLVEAEAVSARGFELIIESNPVDPAAYSQRGSTYAKVQQWDKAGEDFATAIKLQPDEHWYWYQYASLCLQLGDLDEYRRCCRVMLERFGNTTDAMIAHRIALECLVMPKAHNELKVPLLFAERAVEQDPKSCWHLLILGAAYYRAGRFEPAVERLEQALQASQRAIPHNLPHFLALRWLFLALTYHGMGQNQQARHCLEEAVQGMDTNLPKPGRGVLGEHWGDWIRCQIVRREAEALLKKDAPDVLIPIEPDSRPLGR
jgi:serine/threonine-protein kinase